MSTHTEDTKEMTVENLLKDIDYWKSQERNGHSFEEMNKAVEALKECVRTTLTLYASQVREKRDREIVAYCDEQIAHEIGLGGKNGNKQVIETYEYVKEFIKL